MTVSATRDRVGTILTDRGRTLYMWVADKGGMSSCSGACAKAWPPLTTAARPMASGGAQAGMLATTRRPDGTMQVTYAGHPLYFYAEDDSAGQMNGQASKEFGADWFVVAPSGHSITTGDDDAASGSSSSSSDSDSSGGASAGATGAGGSSSSSSGGDAAGGGWG
ncbi:MAG TPA: hypothetical protein VGM91_09350 [Conexibacter sp.]